ncbi:MAG: lamin tail domain-containing protein [Bacteroidales bacterium]|nr:lamin tail domain-containing protein [Bacteroidales bacterium]MBO7622992.1 lamin tail domain-containing protein [Bacteroidales bacterium]MBP5741096.1 lamin tail domain-containing protein [Bacteroidales bacterium]
MKKIFIVSLAAIFALTGCLKDETFKGPSNIDKVVFTPEAPTSVDAVTVTATISGLQAVKTATLAYNGTETAMTGSGKTYTGTIPAMADGAEVEFIITVVNEAGLKTVSDKYSYKVGDPATDWSTLKLNEVCGAGADEEKFFELYNTGNFDIKLTGVTINKDEELTWTGIDGEVIKAKGYFAIIGGKGTTERGFKSGFSAKKSVRLDLYNPSGELIDFFQRGEKGESGWGASIANWGGSWSRVPDGTGKWMATEATTAGAANSTAAVEDELLKND